MNSSKVFLEGLGKIHFEIRYGLVLVPFDVEVPEPVVIRTQAYAKPFYCSAVYLLSIKKKERENQTEFIRFSLPPVL